MMSESRTVRVQTLLTLDVSFDLEDGTPSDVAEGVARSLASTLLGKIGDDEGHFHTVDGVGADHIRIRQSFGAIDATDVTGT